MKKLVHSVCLIFGTCVGAGLVALPMLAVHLGISLSAIIIAAMVYIAWRSSMMTVDLNALHQAPSSIVQLSEVYSGKKAFGITMASFYLLSFSLLTVYFSCVSDTIKSFCHFGQTTGVLVCGLGLLGLLSLKTRVFSQLNTIFVGLLIVVIAIAIFQTRTDGRQALPESSCQAKDLWAFLPVIFTSFGVQNVCHTISCDHIPRTYSSLGLPIFAASTFSLSRSASALNSSGSWLKSGLSPSLLAI